MYIYIYASSVQLCYIYHVITTTRYIYIYSSEERYGWPMGLSFGGSGVRFFFSQNKSGTRSVKSKIIFQARFKNKSHAVYA